ncbi:MAG TPA: PQQ-dependent sugar dehydrogenase [Xanthomonadales bacterium]|nr:PQQ-dependent sugar dehydrogenase [Xanthomonadales bacterium]
MRTLLCCLLLAAAMPTAALDFRTTALNTSAGPVVDIVNAGDGTQRLYLVGQDGFIRVFAANTLRSEPFLDISGRIAVTGNEQGLLSAAFPPNYASKRYFYVLYTAPDRAVTVSRFRVAADNSRADPASEQVVLRVPHPETNHNGGRVVFGPDGYLYVSIGDGGGANDPFLTGQNRNSLLGKLLRIDTESGDATYRVPATNPFVGQAGVRPEIWAFGLRNPWRFSFDRATGDLWIADVGQSQREEVDFQPANGAGGQNYGWSVYEGTRCFRGGESCNTPGLTQPIAEYDHSQGCSITGGYVYRGSAYPGLVGTYLYADYCSGRIWSITRNGGAFVSTLIVDSAFGISTFGEDERGNLYIYDSNNTTLYLISDGAPVQAGVPIGAGFTGTWFDPAQSGHGLFVEVLPNDAMVVSWFTFRPEGGQAWFLGSGDIQGDRAVIEAVYPQGGRFIPNFDPNQVTRPNWGRLTITFSDCNNGRVDYESVQGFGTGSMRLTRLTNVAGVSCP